MRTSPDEHLPWWLLAALGLACAGLGTFLVFRPFTSLSVLLAIVIAGSFLTGVTTIVAARRSSPRWPAMLAGTAWIIVGVILLAWPDITTNALAVVVGMSLIIGGVLDAAAGLRNATDERLAAVISGIASVVFGVLALSWPSVTVLVVAVVFGARLVLVGLRLAWSAVRERSGKGSVAAAPEESSRLRRFGHLLGAVVALVVAVMLAGVSAGLNRGEPVVDAFYDTPDEVPPVPGEILRIEPFTRTIPDDAQAWRILYTTTRADGVAAVASALVVAPREPADVPRPVIALAHGTTGVDRSCAPSVLADPFAAGAFFALDRVIDEGWTLVATDYIGLGTEAPHPYLVGEPAGRSVLDSVRAARQIPDLALADQTVVWGHSQGGGAALWTGILAPAYAPDTNVIGVAALAPASDLVGLVSNLGDVPGGSIFAAYVLHGYASAYDDVSVDDYVRPSARTSFDEVIGRCLAEPAALLSVIGSVALGDEIFSTDLASGALLERFEQNVPTDPIEAPLLVAQGESDQLVLPSVQTGFVAARCAEGQDVDYRTYEGLDHVPLVEADSPLIAELIEWTHSRLAGDEPTPNCAE
jgi:uncharacterized membrane protein HdeD (DUF308 family)/alpha-beta hydrolase superfamily lysophospholipase